MEPGGGRARGREKGDPFGGTTVGNDGGSVFQPGTARLLEAGLRAMLHVSAHARRTCTHFRGFSRHDPLTEDVRVSGRSAESRS